MQIARQFSPIRFSPVEQPALNFGQFTFYPPSFMNFCLQGVVLDD
jgi:hypothetical protein